MVAYYILNVKLLLKKVPYKNSTVLVNIRFILFLYSTVINGHIHRTTRYAVKNGISEQATQYTVNKREFGRNVQEIDAVPLSIWL